MIRRAVSPLVGLGAEALAHRKNKKEATASAAGAPEYESSGSNPPPSEPAAFAAADEEDWDLDDAAIEADAQAAAPVRSCVPAGTAGGPASINKLVEAFLTAYPVAPTGHMLPCPVVIPQKRPGNKTRGFVRAYAPVLESVGIPPTVWLDFMRSFEEAIRVSPVFDAVNVGVQIAGLLGNVFPSAALMAATTALTAADIAAQRTYQRSRYNDFLTQLNRKFFQPLGLYCLIMTYDPQSSAASEPWDLSAALAKHDTGGPEPTGLKLQWKTLKGIEGRTRGEAQMPQAAELIYPAIDATLDLPEGAKPPGWWGRSTAFVADYLDRRAQAHYSSQNPDTVLAMQPEFESPHGGTGTALPSMREKRTQRMDALREGGLRAYGQHVRYAAKEKAHRTQPGEQPPSLPPSAPQQQGGRATRLRLPGGGGGPVSLLVTAASGGKLKGKDARPVNIVRRVMKPGAMYLMVTNMPTKEELAQARQALEMVDC